MAIPTVVLRVFPSFTSKRSEFSFLAACFLTKISGSWSVRRTMNATTAGKRPIRNMPRQPIRGSNIGVTNAAKSTPDCHPSAT